MAEGSLSLSSQNLIARVAAPVVGCVFAFVLGMMLVNDRDNALASFMTIVGFVGFFMGAISPKLGLFFLIFLCGYLDFIKRLLVLFGDANMDDVIQVLRVAPFVLIGTLSGLVVAYAFRRFQLKRLDWILLAFIAFIEAAVIGSSLRNGGGLAEAANTGVYVPLLVIIPLVLKTVDEMLSFCRVMLFVFLPIALYGIWQSIFGLADFEFQYMLSGLTITAGAVDVDNPRPFATLNSSHAFTMAMSICLLLSCALAMRPLRRRTSLWNNSLRFTLPVVFFVASIVSLGRTGWGVWIFGGIGFYAFKTSKRTATFYAVAILAFVMLVANAQFIYQRLDYIESFLPTNSDVGARAFQIGTYSERLFGYMNIVNNKELLTWFGNPTFQDALNTREDYESGTVHDAIGQVLLNYGLVGLFVVVVGAGAFLFWAHRHALRLRSERTRIFTLAMLSTALGVVASGMLGGSSLSVFPINFMFWSVVGLIVAVAHTQEERDSGRLEPGIVRLRYQRPIASRLADARLQHST